MCVRTILPSSSVLSSSVPNYGLTQLGLRSYPSGLLVPETTTTLFSFVRCDRPVYATASVRPVGPCQPTAAMAGPSFLTSGIPVLRNLSVSGGIYDFYGRLHTGVGHRHMGFTNFGYLNPSGPRAPHQLLGTQGGRGRPTSLGFRATRSCWASAGLSKLLATVANETKILLATDKIN